MGDQLGPLLLAAGALAVFGRGFLRLRRRGAARHAGWDRAALFVLAVALMLVGLVALDSAAEELVSAHMLQHVLIGDAVPALALVALRGPLVLAVAPARFFARSRAVALLLRPATAFVVWAVALAAWHVPPLYEAALERPALHLVEHACFVVGGVLVWAQLVDPARRRALSTWGSLGYALLLMATAQLLVTTLVVTDHPLYSIGSDRREPLLGLSPLEDQQAAGLVMLVEQLVTLGTFAALRLAAVARAPLALREGGHPLAG